MAKKKEKKIIDKNQEFINWKNSEEYKFSQNF